MGSRAIGLAVLALLAPVCAQGPMQSHEGGGNPNGNSSAPHHQGTVQNSTHSALEHAQLGLSFAKQEKYKEAVLEYRKAASLDPALPRLQLNLGLA